MNKPITMRELQKMSASAIESLEGPVAIRCDGRTVGYLEPVHRPSPPSAERAALADAASARIAEEQARWSPEQRRIVDDILARHGFVDA